MCDRRITNGKMDSGKKYMVYLVNSLYSEHQPESWVCGGVLISDKHVLTSAACLTEVSHMYVIAGYKKYVSGKDIDNDDCTRSKKQKIVKIIIPKAFNGTTWMQYDVGLGVVEKSYNFSDISYRYNCSYKPGTVMINFNIRREFIKSSVVALGWGANNGRQPGMIADTNSEYLMQTNTVITNITYCRKQFPKDVEYLFLCTDDNPVVNTRDVNEFIPRGREVTLSPTTITTEHEYVQETWRCAGMQFSSNIIPAECVDFDSSELRRRLLPSNDSATSLDDINGKNTTALTEDELDINETISRKGTENGTCNSGKGASRSGKVGDNSGKGAQNVEKGKTEGKEGNNLGGICQNDHGGPLILTKGKVEMVIGIALNSVYDKEYKCKGPFLFLSTARAHNIIKCLQPKKYFPKDLKHCSNNYEAQEYDVVWPNDVLEPQKEATKDSGNGNCETTKLLEVPLIESMESGVCAVPSIPIPLIPVPPIPVPPTPVQPKSIFNIRFPYKRPNLNMKFFYSRPIFNLGQFTKRPTF